MLISNLQVDSGAAPIDRAVKVEEDAVPQRLLNVVRIPVAVTVAEY
jgi:hypothetical protein